MILGEKIKYKKEDRKKRVRVRRKEFLRDKKLKIELRLNSIL